MMQGGIHGDQEFLDAHVVIPRAELTRLREERDRAVTQYSIGAFLASDDDTEESALKSAHAEIARLREENESLLDANVSIRRDLQTSWEEKDRLREELQDKRLSRYEPTYVGELEDENESLRARITELEDGR